MKDRDLSKLAEIGLRRLKNRLARLQRLIELEAPPAVLAWQTRLIADAGKLLDPEAYFTRERETWVQEQRFKLGLCAECDEAVMQPLHVLDVPPLESVHCAVHVHVEEDDDSDEEPVS